MSSNKDIALYNALIAIGRKEAKEHKWLIKDLKALLKKIILPDLPLEERILAAHQLGLYDNKIDKVPDVNYLLRMLSDELDSQRVYLDNEQFKNLQESVDRCNYFLSELARLISPTNMDMSEGEEDEPSTKPATIGDLAI